MYPLRCMAILRRFGVDFRISNSFEYRPRFNFVPRCSYSQDHSETAFFTVCGLHVDSTLSDGIQGAHRWHIELHGCLVHIVYVAKGILVFFSQLDDELLEG